MYDIYLKLKRVYNLNLYYNPTAYVKQHSLIKNDALIEYANSSLKKSIRKIEDRYKDPNYKIKNIVAHAVFNNVDDSQQNSASPFILGATYCFLLLLYINNANGR
jgi:hypothetical protein